MRLHFICGCKLENYTLEDWLAHWKHGRSKWRAIWLFLKTRIVLS